MRSKNGVTSKDIHVIIPSLVNITLTEEKMGFCVYD